MTTWTLLLFVGVMMGPNQPNTVSNAVTTISGFGTMESCAEAGKNSSSFLSAGVRRGAFYCVQVDGPVKQ